MGTNAGRRVAKVVWIGGLILAIGCAPDDGQAGSSGGGFGGTIGTAGTGGSAGFGGVGGSAGFGSVGGSAGFGGVGGAAGFGAVGGSAGCGGEGGSGGDSCEAIAQVADVELGPVDIVWVIDASCSMDDEKLAVQMNLNNFASVIEAAGIDHHVVIITDTDLAAGTTLGSNPQHYRFIQHDVGSHDLYDVLVGRFNDSLFGPGYGSFLRANAPTHFVAVTDDESAPMTAAQFRTSMEGLLGHGFIQHAVASESINGQPCSGGLCFGIPGIPCIPIGGGAANVGAQYYALADQTGGQKISICESDWSMVFGPLQDAVVASVPLPCNFAIPAAPSGMTFDMDNVHFERLAPGQTSGVELPRAQTLNDCGTGSGWYYDDNSAPAEILLCPAACDTAGQGGSVNIVFGCNPPPPLIVD